MSDDRIGKLGKFDSEFFSAQVVGEIKEIIPGRPDADPSDRAVIRLHQRIGIDPKETHIDVVVPWEMVTIVTGD